MRLHLMLLLLGAGCSPSIDARADDEIRQATAAFDSAWFRQDTAAVARIMSPAYTYFSSRGDVIPRAQALSFLNAPDYKLEASDRSEVTPVFEGNTAIVSTRWRGHGTWKEGTFVDDQRCSMTWHRAFDGWRLVSEHCTQIVSSDSAA